jgi:RecA/RadA recombinase
MLQTGELFGEDSKNVLDDFVKSSAREIFCAWKIQKAIDTGASGGLNYGAIESLRKVVEELDRYERGILPSSSVIQAEAAALEEMANNETTGKLPYEKWESKNGECYKFEFECVVRLMLDAFGLTEIARTVGGVQIAITLDGAELFDHASHVMGGVKITDKRARDPSHGLSPIEDDEMIQSLLGKIQTRDACACLKILFAKDSKTTYDDDFSDMFEYAEQLRTVGIAASRHGPALKPFDVSLPQDMASFWKALGMGGAAKVKEFFCHLCSCRSSDILQSFSGPNRCEECDTANREQCRHHSVCDTALLERFTVELADRFTEYLAMHGAEIKAVSEKTELILNDEVNASNNPRHIHFDPPVIGPQRVEYVRFITQELRLRNLELHGTLDDRREKLLNSLYMEQKYALIQCVLSRSEGAASAMKHLIEDAIPCGHHMENRVGEKILQMLLSKGLDAIVVEEVVPQDDNKKKLSLKKKTVVSKKKVSKKKKKPKRNIPQVSFNEFVNKVQLHMNTKILGTERRPAQWSMPVTDKKELGPISMTNTKVRKIINSMDELIASVLPDIPEEKKTLWYKSMDCYRDLIVMVRQREDFTEDDIQEFSELCDDFYDAWIKLHDREGITNYIHMIGSGHVSYYLRRYKNLYRFSQQGWESLNSKVKRIFYKNTQKGGRGSRDKTYLLPVVRFLQRDLLWKTGLADRFFEERYYNEADSD